MEISYQKIHESEPNKDNPWEDDVLGRRVIAEFLTNMLSSTNTPFVINLNSPWGTGKTFFLKRWKLSIQDTHPSLLFNAWETDYSEVPFIAFISEIQAQLSNLDKEGKELKGKVQEWVEKSGRIILKGIPLLIKGGVRYALGESGLEEAKDLLDTKIEDDIADYAGKLAGKAVDDHLSKRQSIHEFKSLMEEAVSLIPQTDANLKPPLFIFIDELDRCRPTYAIELLENIKHLFSVPGVVFILATDSDQLGHSIRSVYGQGIDAGAYLRRFIDQTYQLPEPSYEQFAELLFRTLNMPIVWEQSNIEIGVTSMTPAAIFGGCSTMFRLSLREQEQCCSKIRAVISNYQTHIVHYVFLCYLLMAQIKLVDDYQLYRQRRISLGKFYNQINDYFGGGTKPKPIFDAATSYFNYVDQKANLRNKINEFRNTNELSEVKQNYLNLLRSIEESFDDCTKHIEFAEMAARLS